MMRDIDELLRGGGYDMWGWNGVLLGRVPFTASNDIDPEITRRELSAHATADVVLVWQRDVSSFLPAYL